MKRQWVSVALCVVSLAGCADEPADDASDPSAQPIVRGKAENKLPQIVAVHVSTFAGYSQCSGTYIAPRVVVTAAHCLVPGAIPGQTFVYYGKDYLTDRMSLPNIPPPGEKSDWARAESAATHPDYSAAVNYPDFLILHLDRELPFEPIPIYRKPVTSAIKEGQIVGWGGSKALVADISVVEGAGIKRSAKVKILGTPTEADFHADDPNPGILDPAIRANLLKTDGMAPKANTCAGDSGGPLLIKDKGKDYLAGVGFWTGLFCEDYAIFTRIDPFLAYFDDAVRRAGKAPIVPRLECVVPQSDGSFKAYYGYQNDNALTVSIPRGLRNLFPKDRADARPAAFAPADNQFVFNVPFASGEKLAWLLVPPAGPPTLVRADATSPACEPNNPTLLCANMCDASLAAECALPGISRSQCMADCKSNDELFAYFGCTTEWNAYLACVTALSPAAENWSCSFPGFPPPPAPPLCSAEVTAALTCAGYY